MEPAFSTAAPLVWGRLASVRRAVAWAAMDDDHASSARFLGSNCARLLDDVIAGLDDASALRDALESTRTAFLQLDELAPSARAPQIARLQCDLEALLPLSQAGARLGGLEPVAALFAPTETPQGRQGPPSEARPEARRPPDAARAEPRAEPRPEPARVEPRPEPVQVAAASPDRAGLDAAAEGGRLPLGHPDASGAPLAGLDHLSADLVERLEAVGIGSYADALMNPPSGFHRPTLLTAPPVPIDPVMIRGRVVALATRHAPGRRYAEVTLQGQELRVVCRWQGALPWRCAGWQRGMEVAVVGVLAPIHEHLWSLDDGEPVGVDGRGSGLMPEYGLDGVSDREVRDLVARALHETIGGVRDPLPDDLLERYKLLPLDEALRDAHFPANTTGRGRQRLAFEELLALQIALARRATRANPERGMAHKALHSNVGQLHVQFSLSLDDEQETAFSEIRRDLIRPVPMARVLLGDVGVAKGLVALLSAVLVADNRAQVAVICPTVSAAERQYLFAEPMLRAIGVKSIQVGDTVTHAAADAIRRGEVHIVYATPRAVTGDLEWRRLGLVVLVEHRTLGALHPGELDGKGPRPDLLVVTAGPLPPSLLLGPYSGFDISVVRRTKPARVGVRAFAAADRDGAYAVAREQIAGGRQVFVVFPSRDGLDAISRDEAGRIAEMLRVDTLRGARVAVFSSDMPRDERARVIDDFAHRRVDVLVATTSVEDGPPVPNATVVIVELADRLDLIRLHRLRAHVGHGPVPGHCLLVRSDEPSADGLSVLDRFLAEPDRLQLMDEDLDAPGGPRLAEGAAPVEPAPLAWSEMPRDLDLLVQTRNIGFRILREDATLRRYAGLRRVSQDRWPELLGEPERGAPSVAQDKARRRRKRRRRR